MELVLFGPGVLVSVLITPQGSPAKFWHAGVHERPDISVSPRPSI
ncbi:MAG TPA: hypothetical protein VFP54_03625 [Acidimicrobiales bacterium]|nr:hypothetical protein [Acidimicrobiales bacterium]